jgi:sugar transferase (PEP-CTERM system associated)
MSALLECKLLGVSILEGETFHEQMYGKIPLKQLKPSWMVFSDGFKSLKSMRILERLFDIILATVSVLILSPLFIITALAIKLDSKGPVFYKQIRLGENEKEFEMYKFRSMRPEAESHTGPVWTSEDDDRITRVGNFIRQLRIDEIPQFINVLIGNMSFVGPRPERPYFVEKLSREIPYYNMRMVVKPGITGWAQINYPYGATTEDAMEKLKYDIYYIKHISPMLDVMIILWTFRIVLFGKGAR